MSDLKTQLIKLGSMHPELRSHIRPLLKKASSMDVKFQDLLNKWTIEVGLGIELGLVRDGWVISDMEWSFNEQQVWMVGNENDFMQISIGTHSAPRESQIVCTIRRRVKGKMDNFVVKTNMSNKTASQLGSDLANLIKRS